MRRAPVGLALTVLTALLLLPLGTTARGGWVRVTTEYQAVLAVLPAYSQWHFNVTRGVGELWTVNLSVSGSGFNPLTVLIADARAYADWCATNATTGCLVLTHVNWSLNAQAAFPHASNWHIVLANPFRISLLFSLTVTLHQWNPATTTDPPGDLLDRIGDALGWLLTVAVVVFVVVPCACGCVRRRGSHATRYEEVIYDEIAE